MDDRWIVLVDGKPLRVFDTRKEAEIAAFADRAKGRDVEVVPESAVVIDEPF